MRFLLFFISCITFLWGYDALRGKSIVLTLPTPTGIIQTPEQNISVVLHPSDRSRGIAIIPIDYYAQSREVNATWIAPGKETPISLNILDADYPTETLSVDPSKVTPPPEAMERIAMEKAEAEAIYARFTPIRYWDKPFILPIDSNVTSTYGSSRTYNGVLKSYHGGTDFRARTPLPVYASNDGVVVLAKERYYAGGTIIIDHGEGIYTCYFHLSRFDVAPGDLVKRGAPIALTGATGRITGPHLHFGIMVHGLQSDPLDLVAQIEKLFDNSSAVPSISALQTLSKEPRQ